MGVLVKSTGKRDKKGKIFRFLSFFPVNFCMGNYEALS
ncbi:Uncharacterized protein dnm_049560 [Desulfonema magnum]|uniref:Uncharacterized protein n=1 Tax=Desulfonema magnum TaxID=45655 RepID=A0A975BNE7_9BACT|nr:Uncharacterized protein dnm_049560 [Desulfonema magnum]